MRTEYIHKIDMLATKYTMDYKVIPWESACIITTTINVHDNLTISMVMM